MTSERVEELVAEFIELRELGEAIGIEAFLAKHAGVAQQLRVALEAFERTDRALPREDLLPDRVGKWRVLGPLARGGMGTVLRVVEDGGPGDVRALKLLGHGAFANPRAHERLRREGVALTRLEHPGMVRCHEFGFSGAVPFLVMDLVAGSSLAQLIEDAREARPAGDCRSPACARLAFCSRPDHAFARVAEVVADLTRTVAALHGEGLLHRDLKPANVLFDAELGRPILIDFGLVGGEMLASLTRTGDVVGTPAYMAPEQALGRSVGVPADVFGLGAILFELLTLQRPRSGGDSLSVLDRAKTLRVPRCRRIDPDVPPALERICQRALSWHARWRYASALDMARDLEAFAQRRNPHVRGPSLAQRAFEGWQFHRPWIVGAGVAGLIGLTWLLAGRAGLDRATTRAALAPALDAFVDGEDAGLRDAVARLAEVAPQDPTAVVLETLARKTPRLAAGATPYQRSLFAACRALRGRDYKRALASLRDAANADPERPAVALLTGFAARGSKDRGVALRELSAAVRLLPRSRVAARELASAFRKIGRLEDAERVLSRVFAAAGSDWRLLAARARLREAQRRPGEALADVEAALPLIDGRPPRSLLNLKGVLLDTLERPAEADAVFGELLDLYPDYAPALYNRAFALDGECKLERARRAYERVLVADKHYTDALLCLAWLRSGSNRETCKKCQAAFARNPGLYDVDQAERDFLNAISATEGRSSTALATAVQIARRIDRRTKLASLLEKLRSREGISDSRLGRLTRALRKLRAR